MIDNVVFISDVQQSGSVIRIPITILFQILSLRLLQNIDPLEKGMATHSSILTWFPKVITEYWSSREGNGYPLQYSCLGNPMDRGAWRAAAPGVAKSHTLLSDWHFHCLTEYWVEFTVLYSRSVLIICYMYISVYMLIPVHNLSSPLPFPFGNHKFVVEVSESVSVL